jgi:hypothetical protein
MDDRAELGWRKSSKSSTGNCVEIADDGERVLMRDSKDPSGAVLAFDREVFRAFVAELKRGGAIAGEGPDV